MAKCAISEKSAHFGNNVSHSHRRSNKMWKSNVKSVRVKTEGGLKEDVRMYFLLKIRKCRESLNDTLPSQRCEESIFFAILCERTAPPPFKICGPDIQRMKLNDKTYDNHKAYRRLPP